MKDSDSVEEVIDNIVKHKCECGKACHANKLIRNIRPRLRDAINTQTAELQAQVDRLKLLQPLCTHLSTDKLLDENKDLKAEAERLKDNYATKNLQLAKAHSNEIILKVTCGELAEALIKRDHIVGLCLFNKTMPDGTVKGFDECKCGIAKALAYNAKKEK